MKAITWIYHGLTETLIWLSLAVVAAGGLISLF